MKTVSIIFISMIAFAACRSDEAKDTREDSSGTIRFAEKKVADPIDSTKFTTVEWLDSLKDFGSVKAGEKVDIRFRFRNTGDKPLIVQSVHAGCGCTVPEYTQEPVMPGKEGFIKAVFNSANQPPTVHKTISVVMNTKGSQSHTVAFIGEVIK